MNTFRFACPSCGSPLQEGSAPSEQHCPAEGTVYRQKDGIWPFLTLAGKEAYGQFILEYETVRRVEGRGSSDPAFYRALPFEDRSGRFRADWQIRARSYQALLDEIVVPLEKRTRRTLSAVDLGAGNGWLAYRLAQRGHQAAAVDLLTNPLDGLGSHVHYDAPFTPIQADFNHLPFIADQMDLVVFNASLHYSTRYETTLCEAWRILKPGGELVLLDSPLYQDAGSGAQMVREREGLFRKEYGFASNALPSENFLTRSRLMEVGQRLGTRWQLYRPFYGWGWELRPWKARLLGRREPAQFYLIHAAKPGEAG